MTEKTKTRLARVLMGVSPPPARASVEFWALNEYDLRYYLYTNSEALLLHQLISRVGQLIQKLSTAVCTNGEIRMID
jgi:hypothetical protein